MFIKKIIIIASFSLLIATNAFAGKEDWTGSFSVNLGTGSPGEIIHTPKEVSFLFMHAGKCLHLGKGSKINGIEIKENTDLCTDSNVATFSNEVAKLGPIVKQSITLGPTYSN